MTEIKQHISWCPLRVPKIRFKEFSWEWDNKKFQDFSKINQWLQIPISERYTEKVENSYFYITNEFLREWSEKKYYIKNPTESVICNKDDLLMTRTWNTWKVVTWVEWAFHNNFFKIKYNKSVVDKYFIYLFLTSQKTQNKILSLAGTSTIPDLNHGDFYKLKINLPSLSEQQKIASFLSSIDKKIENIKEKKKNLEEYKKWVLQKIFSKELRFKDKNWEEFGEWEEIKLGEFLKEFNKKTTENNQYQVLSSTNKWLFLQSEYFNDRQIASKDNIWYKILFKNQLVFSPQNLWMWNINLNTKFEVWIVSPSYKIFQINESKCLVNYVNYIIKTNRMLYKYIQASEQWASIVRRNLDVEEFKAIKINIPSLVEQEKIANFLIDIDKKIEKVSQELEKNEEFKKGLLQGMFV